MQKISHQIATEKLPKKTKDLLWPKQVPDLYVQRRIPLFCMVTANSKRLKKEAIYQIYLEVKGNESKFIS